MRFGTQENSQDKERWPKQKSHCVICRKKALPNDFRCQKCWDQYLREMVPIWKAQGCNVLNGDKY